MNAAALTAASTGDPLRRRGQLRTDWAGCVLAGHCEHAEHADGQPGDEEPALAVGGGVDGGTAGGVICRAQAAHSRVRTRP